MRQGQVHGHLTWTNLSTGLSVEDRFSFNFTLTDPGETDFLLETNRGKFAIVNDPQPKEVLFVAGPHEIPLGGTIEAFC